MLTHIAIPDLEDLARRALAKAGFRPQDAATIVEHFVTAELAGRSSHGIVRIVQTINISRERGVSQRDPEIVLDLGSRVVFDAHGQAGPVSGKRAMEETITRTREHGLAFVGTRNHLNTTGAMAWYARRLADAGIAAIIGCQSVALVAPPGGKKRALGTNPLGIAIPGADGDHFIADFGTSAISYGALRVLMDRGERAPEGTIIDADGHPSTDPKDGYGGAMLPFGGYKGFAIGLMIELLAGPLIGATPLSHKDWDNDGLFMIGIDPSPLRPGFAAEVAAALREIRESPPRPGAGPVTLPGDRSAAALEAARKSGHIEVVTKTLENLKAQAD